MKEYRYNLFDMKRHHFFIIIGIGLGLGIVLAVLLTRSVQTLPETVPQKPVSDYALPTSSVQTGFGIYLSNNVPFLEEKDVVAYDPARYHFVLTDNGADRINQLNGSAFKGMGNLFQKPFTVTLNGRVLYRGVFWSMLSSALAPGIEIDFPRMQRDMLTIGMTQVISGAQSNPPTDERQQPLLATYFSTLGKITTTPSDEYLFTSPTATSFGPVSPYQQFYTDVQAQKVVNSSTVSIQFFGDIMLDRNVAKAMGKDGLDYLLKDMYGDRGLDPRIDVTVANNEGPYAPERVKTSKSIAFRFDPALAPQLKTYGFDVVSLANNHTLDMGWKNVDFTHQTLDAAGVGHFGDQIREGKEFTYVTTTAGQSIAFVGFNNTDHILDLKKISAIILDAHARASTTIVMMHWGTEYQRASNKNQQTFAHFLIDQGVDAVIGAHPHVVEEAEIYKGKPIFYSLGNFIFDQYFSTDTQEGLSVGLILQHGKVASVYAFPLQSAKSQPTLMDGARRDDFYGWLNKNSRLGGKQFEGGKIILGT